MYISKNEKQKWDDAALNYQDVFKLGINEYNARLLRFWQEKGMLFPGCRVIDIGCGVGKYGTYLASLGCDVTLTDISQEMIRHAKENMAKFSTPWTALCCDFSDITGEEEAFAHTFDLAISTMSPAIHDCETVRKMSSITRGWCFIARFFDWQQPLRDELMTAAGLTPKSRFERSLKLDCEDMLNAVRDAGFTPQIEYVDYNWADERSAGEMAEYMYRNYFMDDASGEELKSRIHGIITEKYGAEGRVADCVNTKVAWIYWKTEERI